MQQLDASAPDEAALLAGWVGSQDEACLSALIELHRPMVTGVCRRILRRAGDVEDAVQETFVALAGKAATIEGSIGGWLRVVATRNAMAQLRALQRQRFQDRQADPVAPVPGEVPTDIVDACLAELTVAERDLIVRLFYLGETQADIARLDRSSRLQIHRRLQQALERLRTLARRRGLRIAPAALLLLLSGGDEATAAEAARRPQMAKAPLVGVAVAGLLLAGIWLVSGRDAPAPAVVAPDPAAVEGPPISGIPPASILARPETECEVVRELPWQPGQRIAAVWPGHAAGLIAGVAFEELEVAVQRATSSEEPIVMIPQALMPRYMPLVECVYIRPVLLRWRDGSESIGLRCVPPHTESVLIRAVQRAYDGVQFSVFSDGDRVQSRTQITARRCWTQGGDMLHEYIETVGVGPPLRVWARSPWLKDHVHPFPLAFNLSQPCALITLQFVKVDAEEAQAMDARCPGSNLIVSMDPVAPLW